MRLSQDSQLLNILSRPINSTPSDIYAYVSFTASAAACFHSTAGSHVQKTFLSGSQEYRQEGYVFPVHGSLAGRPRYLTSCCIFVDDRGRIYIVRWDECRHWSTHPPHHHITTSTTLLYSLVAIYAPFPNHLTHSCVPGEIGCSATCLRSLTYPILPPTVTAARSLP